MKKICLLYTVLCTIFITVSVYSQSTESLMSAGNMLLSNGAYDQAVTKFRKVIARDPGNFEAQFNLAFAYLNWGRSSNAVTEFKKAVSINPSSAEAWSNLAMAYENLGQSDNALNALYKAVDKNPSNIQARLNLATMYANKGRLSQAVSQYKQIVGIDGTNLDAHINLGKCLVSQNKFKEAKHYLKGAIGINSNDPEAYWELANILWNKDKDAEGAITNYKKAIALNPNSQVYYENLGLLYENLNKKKEALAVWKKWLIYLDDALKKEEVQRRVDMLERGESPSGKATPEELFGKDAGKGDIEKLQQEMRKEEETSTQKVDVEGLDLGSDLSDLEEDKGSSFDFDMKKAVEEKKKEK